MYVAINDVVCNKNLFWGKNCDGWKEALTRSREKVSEIDAGNMCG